MRILLAITLVIAVIGGYQTYNEVYAPKPVIKTLDH